MQERYCTSIGGLGGNTHFAWTAVIEADTRAIIGIYVGCYAHFGSQLGDNVLCHSQQKASPGGSPPTFDLYQSRLSSQYREGSWKQMGRQWQRQSSSRVLERSQGSSNREKRRNNQGVLRAEDEKLQALGAPRVPGNCQRANSLHRQENSNTSHCHWAKISIPFRPEGCNGCCCRTKGFSTQGL